MEELLSSLQEMMVRHRFWPNQKLSQNFVVNEGLLDKIVDAAELKKSDSVTEVGCGTGFLTQRLLSRSKVIGYELDMALAELLEKRFGNNQDFRLVRGDFMASKKALSAKVVSLPPYGISTGLMLRLFGSKARRAVLVFQREFTEKLVSEPGYGNYNYLSALTRIFFEPKILIHNIRPECFYPKPEAQSSLIVLQARKKKPEIKDAGRFIRFLKHLFRFKNKNLSNALRNLDRGMGKDSGIKAKWKELLSDTGFLEQRVAMIEPEDFAVIFSRISR